MANKKKENMQPMREIEIINRRTKQRRKINLDKKEKIVYNAELNEFQLLYALSASYDVDSDPKNE